MRHNSKGERGVGKRLNPNVNKAHILLYIACYPDTEFSGIRKHIYGTLNLTTRKPIDIQLDALVNEKIILRTPKSKGEKGYYLNYYQVKNTFHAFKTTYELLKRQGLKTEFMKSKYYRDYVNSDDFLNKLPLNFFKQNILDLHKRIKDDEKRKQFIKEIKQNPHTRTISNTIVEYQNNPLLNIPDLQWQNEIKFKEPISNLANVKTRSEIKKTINLKYKVIRAINKISQSKGDDPIANAFLSLVETLNNTTIDEFYDIYRERFGYMAKGQSLPTDMERHFRHVRDLFVPDGKEQDLTKILLQSPSAIDFVLNSKYYNRFIIHSLIEYYFKPESDNDGNFFQKLFGWGAPENESLYLEILLELPKENIDVSNVFPGIALLYILRSLIVADIINGEIENNKDTIDSIRTVLFEGKRE